MKLKVKKKGVMLKSDPVCKGWLLFGLKLQNAFMTLVKERADLDAVTVRNGIRGPDAWPLLRMGERQPENGLAPGLGAGSLGEGCACATPPARSLKPADSSIVRKCSESSKKGEVPGEHPWACVWSQ